ncbi:hypothetical protein G3480_05125 [Thiorhodococcus mannitoliphagus]|uniref:VPLPA-CTERM sorting domain-containing protein n=1 Tax=Thiorhodococcus mannitoliphagus TaxID=329406 RepID=A0A6P1DRZ7_9GAMM|nr:hypothetical protein [Thiorhodococcus mannitoliphagus]NEX19701.1 hypothetical protein [Thiorhodococcus mannitoliphagus]
MSTRRFALILVLAFSPGLVGNAFAISIRYEPGITHEARAITEYRTTGAMIEGLEVTAFFSNGASESLSWASSDAASGGVMGSGWSLTQSGDTFRSAWTLSMDAPSTSSTDRAPSIARLVLNAAPGRSVFDVDVTDQDGSGTAGSKAGGAFALEGQRQGLAVTYSDQVAIGNQRALGDLYNTLTLEFSETSFFSAGQSLNFVADMDSILTSPKQLGGLDDRVAVPIPSAVWLFASSLAGIAGIGRWSRKS